MSLSLPRALQRAAVSAAALAALALAPARAMAQEGAPSAPEPPPTKTIYDKLVELGSYTQLLAALDATGLADKLKAPGAVTLYAPSDASFERLPADTLAALKADKARLTRVLAHHVLPDRLDGVGMMHLPIYTKVPTMNGDSMTVYHDKGGIKVDLNLVKTVDILATNGVIHTVHKVMLVP